MKKRRKEIELSIDWTSIKYYCKEVNDLETNYKGYSGLCDCNDKIIKIESFY
ncbi:MAG: hypothetical protein ACP5M8_07815 [Caldisphaera sp.]